MGDRERRLALVGLDGFAPAWLDRLLGEERLPAPASVRRHGVRRHGSEVALTSTRRIEDILATRQSQGG